MKSTAREISSAFSMLSLAEVRTSSGTISVSTTPGLILYKDIENKNGMQNGGQ